VPEQDVPLLDAGRVGRGDAQPHVSKSSHAAPAFSGHSYGEGTKLPRFLQGCANVAALARGGKADHNIARSAQSLQLAVEYFPETAIVSNGGHNGRIRGESKGRQRPAVTAETSHEFGSEMLRVGGAPPVATPEDLVALEKALSHANGGAFEGLLLRVKVADDGDVFGYGQLKRLARFKEDVMLSSFTAS
jgi:hypothetical protein